VRRPRFFKDCRATRKKVFEKYATFADLIFFDVKNNMAAARNSLLAFVMTGIINETLEIGM
jgi:hypothetical protein